MTSQAGIDLTRVAEAGTVLYRTMSAAGVLRCASEDAPGVLGADGVLIVVLDEDGEAIDWVACGIPAKESAARTAPLVEAVRESGHSLLMRVDGTVVPPPDPGPVAWAAFPARGDKDRVLAILVLAYETPRSLAATPIWLAATYVDQLAGALDNARRYETAEAERRRLTQVFDSTSDGILLLTPAGSIQAINRRAADLLACRTESVVGLAFADLLVGHYTDPADCDRGATALLALLANPEEGGAGDLVLPSVRRILQWTARPTLDGTRQLIGVTLTLQDVTREREISQMKSDFVSFVTHQLRTPLAGIKWMLELAAEDPDLSDDTRSNIQDARSSNARLIGLVNDLLDASRLESGRIAVHPEPIALPDLTREVLEELTLLVNERGHRVTLGADAALPTVLVDPKLFRQAILNLLSNAIKYTPPGGDVAIRITLEGDRVQWSIRDSGIGIPPSARDRLFEKFYRAENVSTMETEGTGLGLYLVRLIVERFGGRIWYESQEGQGTTFFFTLPGRVPS